MNPRIPARIAFLAVSVVGIVTYAQTGITADHSVGVAPLASFDGQTPSQRWQQINDLEFWAIPRDAPSGYYVTIDASSAARLRSTLHDVIKDHHVFRYTHTSQADRRRAQ